MLSLLALLTMSNLILPQKSGLWLPDRQQVTLARPGDERRLVAAIAARRGVGAGGGGGGDLTAEFFSDWEGAALGTASIDISDNNKWNELGGEGQEVVSTTGLNFPTAKCLKVTAKVSNFGFALNRKTGMSVPSAPFRRYYRWYYRHMKPYWEIVTQDPNAQHPVQDGNSIGDINWAFNTRTDPGGEWFPNFFKGPPRYGYSILQNGHTYRFEVCADVLAGGTTFILYVKVFDQSEALVADSDDFVYVGNGGATGGDTLGNAVPKAINVLANFDGLNCGVNGVFELDSVNAPGGDVLHSYQTGFAVCDAQAGLSAVTDTIGAYPRNFEVA